MTDKQLKDKAIDIKGKAYVLVSDRINYFNETYPNGFIQTELVSSDNSTYVVKACVTPDMDRLQRYFTGYSQAKIGQGMVNTTAALENAETSAVGRALAMMGIGVIDSVASVDEMKKATYTPPKVETDNKGLEVFCEVCGAKMINKTGTKNGKKWSGWFCADKTHPPRWI
jgi:hypothetical protein